MADRFLYVFLDEAGNLDFSKNGTRFFVLGALTVERPFKTYSHLIELKYDLVELGTNLEYFHAAEDTQAVRNRVFEVIKTHLGTSRVDTLIVEKRKTGPALQNEERFYPEMLGYLLRYIVERKIGSFTKLVVFTDRIPVQRNAKLLKRRSSRRYQKCCLLELHIPCCITIRSRISAFKLPIISRGQYIENGTAATLDRMT